MLALTGTKVSKTHTVLKLEYLLNAEQNEDSSVGDIQ